MVTLRTYLVEDSPLLRESLSATLEELVPLQMVAAADDEPSALHWLAHHGREVDLVILDIFLKQGSGLGVLRATQSPPPPYKLVVLSNYATPEVRRSCLALGAAQVFDKSNDIEALVHYCQQLGQQLNGSSHA
ncbi:response regulator [Paucibacter soli]|uniref:response regulator n=1 Tax=Paucibacter soli TaxID=3133433 RepID=UPI0030B293C1